MIFLSLLVLYSPAKQQDYMNPHRYLGEIRKVTFGKVTQVTVAVPDLKSPLILKVNGVFQYEDSGLKKAVNAELKKSFIGKTFSVIVSGSDNKILQDAIASKVELRFPSTLVERGLLFATQGSNLNSFQLAYAKKNGKGIYALAPLKRDQIISATIAKLKKSGSLP